jgi:ADP-ribosyl-[dinitrogen reductase] hydrolase
MNTLEKALGGFLGLAIGDALGGQVEFKPAGTFRPVKEMTGGGFHGLRPGEVTDDTIMALIVARSLVQHKDFRPEAVMNDFVQWKNSDECFDIGVSISEALTRFERDQNPFQGLTGEEYSGNGSIMRLYPSILWTLGKPESEAFRMVWDMSRLTHASELVKIETQKMFTLIRRIFKHGTSRTKADLMEGMTYPLEPVSTGFVCDTFDVALWGFMESEDFEEGLLKVVNLGGDADTAGAVYGQIAGTYYGVGGLPERFLHKLEPRVEIEVLTRKLIEQTQR